MKDMKLLNDEELDKVVGGATIDYTQFAHANSDGTVSIYNPKKNSCGARYFSAYSGFASPVCINCVYYVNNRCTNVDFYNELLQAQQ